MEEKIEQQQMNIELSEDIAQGTYANLAVITHSASEFIMDHIQIMPGVPKAKVRSRIIMTPQNAKRFAKALLDNIEKYEENFGEIEENQPPFVPPINFGGPKAQA